MPTAGIRGEWRESEEPAFWREAVEREIEARRTALHAVWAQRDDEAAEAAIEREVRATLTAAARLILESLYPGAMRG